MQRVGLVCSPRGHAERAGPFSGPAQKIGAAFIVAPLALRSGLRQEGNVLLVNLPRPYPSARKRASERPGLTHFGPPALVYISHVIPTSVKRTRAVISA